MVVTVVIKVHSAQRDVQLVIMESSVKVAVGIVLITQSVTILLEPAFRDVNLDIKNHIVLKIVPVGCLDKIVA